MSLYHLHVEKNMDDIPTLISHDFSEYELYREDILGIGRYGSVFKGKNRRSGATVAMKFFMEDAAVAREEIKLLKKLQGGRFVVELWHDVEFAHNKFVAILEKADMSLSNYMRRDAGVQIEIVRSISWQLSGALRHIHSMGVVHADLKPSNVLLFLVEEQVDDRLRVKLCDFSNSLACGGSIALETCEIVSLP